MRALSCSTSRTLISGEQAFALGTPALAPGVYVVRAEGSGITEAARLTVAR